jgi:DNA-binding response OmpR family regulator
MSHPASGPAVDPDGAATVLLAEGYAVLRSTLRRVLEAAGYRVLEAGAAGEALALSGAHPGPIRALVCDLALRPCGGPDLAARLCQARPETRVLLIGNESVVVEAGGLPLLRKPFGPAELLDALRTLLA